VQRGLGDDARLVMVVHRAHESRFDSALEQLGALEFLRSAPRAIRVLEEQYV
jgi:homoserine dehydrogenase